MSELSPQPEPASTDDVGDAPAARKRPKPGERRVQILQTLATMLEQPGAERITTAALAARSGGAAGSAQPLRNSTRPRAEAIIGPAPGRENGARRLRADRQRDAAFAAAPYGNARRHVVAIFDADGFRFVVDIGLERPNIRLDLGIDAGELVALDRVERLARPVP